MNMGGGGDGVDARVGHGSVARYAFNDDFPVVCRGHRAFAVHDDTRGHRRDHMHRECTVDVRVFEHAFCNCLVRTVVAFFAWLEEQLHSTFQFAFVRFQNMGGAKQGSCVHVMAAGMHVAVDRCELLARFFGHWQAINVASQHKARFAFANGSHTPEPLMIVWKGMPSLVSSD